jgi:hypothetical protein
MALNKQNTLMKFKNSYHSIEFIRKQKPRTIKEAMI